MSALNLSLFGRVKGPGFCVTGVALRKVKSWKTDGTLADSGAHPPTLLALPKGQRSIVQLRWASLQPVTRAHNVSAAKQMSSKHGAFRLHHSGGKRQQVLLSLMKH